MVTYLSVAKKNKTLIIMKGICMFELLQLDDISFLKIILEKYPEAQYLIMENKTTASTNQNLQGPNTLAARVFENRQIDDATEFDRAAVGLLCLKYVLTNDYDHFTACQNPHIKLSKDSFENLSLFTKQVIQTPEDLEVAVYMIMCNDLGKSHVVTNTYYNLEQNKDADHDEIFSVVLKKKPNLFKGFQSLSYKQQTMIQEGLNTAFNLGQFAQGENTPADLPKIQNISKKARDLYILHAFYDVAGAAGHVKNNGSLVMSEPVYKGYDLAIQSLMTEPFSNSYNRYVEIRGKLVGFDAKAKKGFALSRLAALSRCFKETDGQLLSEVFDDLPQNVQSILQKELNETGLNNTSAILIYYAPAFIDNMKKSYLGKLPLDADKCAQRKALYHAYKTAFMTMAQIYTGARISVKKQNATGVITVDINDLAKTALQNSSVFSEQLVDVNINLLKSFGHAQLKETPYLDTARFKRNKSLHEVLPEGKTAYIGIGGGSDCIQAGQIAFLNPQEAACIISIRSEKTQSQGKQTKVIGVNREISNHGGEIIPGVYKVLPTTTASGRFMENLIARSDIPVYVVLDKQDGLLGQKIQAAIQHAGGAKNIVSVDTGGDSLYLYNTEEINSSKATPDQDYASLKALTELKNYQKLSVILATGVDCPSYAATVLEKASGVFICLSDQEKKQILEHYQQWGMDGSSESAFGKTPLALQAALNKKQGVFVLPLPTQVVLDEKNPWNPFIVVTDSMQYVAVMPLEKHFNVITNNFQKNLFSATYLTKKEILPNKIFKSEEKTK